MTARPAFLAAQVLALSSRERSQFFAMLRRHRHDRPGCACVCGVHKRPDACWCPVHSKTDPNP